MGSAIQKFYYGDAERKTSLGRDWHPTCLRCVQCGRVLSPGQHAEHKGNPYCHTPCYNALFGPSLLGYGSNLASPANFAKKDNAAEYGHDYYDDVYKREIYSNSRGTSSSAAAAARKQRQRQSAPPSMAGDSFSAMSSTSSANPDPCVPKKGAGQSDVGGKNVALATTRSADNLGVSPRRGSLGNDPHSLAASSSPVIASAGNNAGLSSTNSNSSAGKAAATRHSRSKSEQVLSVDNRSGSFVVPESVLEEKQSAASGTSRSSTSSSRSRSSVDQSPGGSAVRQTGTGAGHVVDLVKGDVPPRLRDILEKVESFNSHYEGKVHHQMIVDQTPGGEVKVIGPLRIYWGLSRPIQLRQCDDVPALPISKWRHSLCANLNEGVPGQNSSSPSQKLHSRGSSSVMSPNRSLRGIDDSVLLSPSSSADEVVMRRQKVRKFNTVAYRSDAPTKWKRASINGHVFNYDTSVFTPVLGSSTSVTADSSMTSPVVIKTLLEKFKVENSPGEYVLSVVTENRDQTQERLLGESDRPLLERLQLGPDDHYAKIFLKETRIEPEAIVPDTVKLPIMEEEEEETLPAEVEQLMILPLAVLKGIMKKYEKDEDEEVKSLKKWYDYARKKIHHRLEELKTA